ncbi:MAG: MucR family transcriptional regulator [Rhodospirillales bacterium]|nr:MucR family transcriptional regulator [Rhodospirillales bacterium]
MNEELADKIAREDMLRMAVDIVAAYLSNNQVATSQIPDVIHSVFGTLMDLDEMPAEVKAEVQRPAVPIRKSVMPDYIVCLEDGKKLKMLKRHLQTTYSMSPEEYRAKWGLPSEYPMVAPNYAKQRSEFAKRIGLGRKPGEATTGRRARG